MFKKPRFRQPDTTFDATGPLPGVEEQFKERTVASAQTVRANILQSSLYGAIVFGVIALVTTLPNRLQNQQYVLIGIYIATLLAALAITVYRGVKYNVRAATFIGLLLLLGTSTIISDGLYGSGRLYFLTLPVMAFLLWDTRRGLIALVLTLVFVALVGGLMVYGVLPAPAATNVNTNAQLWFISTTTMILLAATTALSVNAMIRSLQGLIDAEQRLRLELDEERSALEGRIQERTSDLQRRLVQLRTAGEITNALSAVLDPQTLLQQVVDLAQERFDLYYVGVFLLDERSENAVLRAGSGEAGQKMLALAHHLPLNGASMIAWCINNRKPRIALDVGNEAVRFSNPHLPLTRSELALPLLTREEQAAEAAQSAEGTARQEGIAIGALTVQSTKAQAFDEDDIVILQSIANALSTALANANLFQQVEANLKEIRTLNRQYLQEAWTRTVTTAVQDGAPLKAAAVDTVMLNTWETTRQKMAEAGTEAAAEDSGVPISVDVPLMVRDYPFGAIHLDLLASEPGQVHLNPEDLAFVEAVAKETAQALENIRLLEETQSRARREQAINKFMGTLSTSLDLNTLLQSATRQLGMLPNVREATLRLHTGREAGPVEIGGPPDGNGNGSPTASGASPEGQEESA